MSNAQERFPDLPPIWALGLMLAGITLGRLLPPGPFQHPAFGLLGTVLILAGLALMAWSALWFRRKRTTILPGGAPARLIVEGPFRVNRNPIYTGMMLTISGAALLWGGPFSLPAVALFPPIVTRRFIRHEEEDLRAAFGEEAGRYFGQSRRW
ncbi:MAG TPA: isoprenylcysteine carboxylmethyltransferase family protein [Paracoccus sp. (in: a-proteobacteria)]|uniref:methyltransferase family protein n=1 Tax=uncultured Paracoccus sp. TaxID=189685 RepID=UPI0026152310|nr:isoprenylcysteine carboxylmethyltransferase family protein [uncultured Paracoccus sp.]HMQ41705.1 isoprenylcysteine carboxylmethyltransferase family protein [Paracoccus sp. (in: a-proteobacteria)]HMR35965.1 isoprenylcysteine carboxylmethyltransferase family protein [Paracoccus sp. (in: a-proteobacteria)]